MSTGVTTSVPKFIAARRSGLSLRGVEPKRRFESGRPIEIAAEALLEQHPHFRGRSRWVRCRFRNGRLFLDGVLPSFYLKQLAQETLRGLEGVERLDNRIVVASPVGEVEPTGIPALDDSAEAVLETPLQRPR
jgi:hypothetical protein